MLLMLGRFGSRSLLTMVTAHRGFAAITDRHQVPDRVTAFRVGARFAKCVGWPFFGGMQASVHLQTVETAKTCREHRAGVCSGLRWESVLVHRARPPIQYRELRRSRQRQETQDSSLANLYSRAPRGAEGQPALARSIHRQGRDPMHIWLPAVEEQIQRKRRQFRGSCSAPAQSRPVTPSPTSHPARAWQVRHPAPLALPALAEARRRAAGAETASERESAQHTKEHDRPLPGTF